MRDDLSIPANTPLGKASLPPRKYAPEVLVGISRDNGRHALGLAGDLPFGGVDLWNAYELSWLDERGKPHVATAELLAGSATVGLGP